VIFLDDQSIPRARRLAAAEAQLRRQWCTPLPRGEYTGAMFDQAMRAFGIPAKRDVIDAAVQS